MNNPQTLDYLESGKRHTQPINCPGELYDIMLMCWKSIPAERPTFEFLFCTMDDYNVAVASSYADNS